MATIDFMITVPVVHTPEGLEAGEQKMIEKLRLFAKDLTLIKGVMISMNWPSYKKDAGCIEYPMSVRLPWYRSNAGLSQIVKKYGSVTQRRAQDRHRFSTIGKDFEESLIRDFGNACVPDYGYMNGMVFLKNDLGTCDVYFRGDICGDDNITSWYIVGNKGKYGFYNKWGQEVIPVIYDKIGAFTKNGLCPVKCNGKYGVINMKAEPLISFQFEHLEALYSDDDRLGRHGLFIAQLDGKYGVIDKTGNVSIPIEYDYLGRNVPKGYSTSDINELQDGYLIVCKEHKVGVIDINNEIVVPVERDINDLISIAYPEVHFAASAERKANRNELKIKSLEREYEHVASRKPTPEAVAELWCELNGMRSCTAENFDDPLVLREWWEQDRQSELRKIKGKIEDISAGLLIYSADHVCVDQECPAKSYKLNVPPMDESILESTAGTEGLYVSPIQWMEGLYVSPRCKVYYIELDIIDATVSIDIERRAMYPYGYKSELEEQQVERGIAQMEAGLSELINRQNEMQQYVEKYKFSEVEHRASLKSAIESAASARQELLKGDFDADKQYQCEKIDAKIQVLERIMSKHCPNSEIITSTKFLQHVEKTIRQDAVKENDITIQQKL